MTTGDRSEMKLKFQSLSFLVVLVLCLPTYSIANPSATVGLGWRFQKVESDSIARSHPDQIGVLNDERSPSRFFSVPVTVRRMKGLSTRSSVFQLDMLDKEVQAYLDQREAAPPSHRRAQILENVPTILLEFGQTGKGYRWIFAKVHGDEIIILASESRDSRPPVNLRDEFFKIAKEFVPR